LNKFLNFADISIVFLTSLVFILLTTLTSYTDLAPFLGLIFLSQPIFFYFFLRIRFAIDLPLLWCCSCSE